MSRPARRLFGSIPPHSINRAGEGSPKCWRVFPRRERVLFGWNMGQVNATEGGLLGYSSEKESVSLKVPPSQGVLSGPKITACHTRMFDSEGVAATPTGGSCFSRFMSLISLFLAGVDIPLLCRRSALPGRRGANGRLRTASRLFGLLIRPFAESVCMQA